MGRKIDLLDIKQSRFDRTLGTISLVQALFPDGENWKLSCNCSAKCNGGQTLTRTLGLAACMRANLSMVRNSRGTMDGLTNNQRALIDVSGAATLKKHPSLIVNSSLNPVKSDAHIRQLVCPPKDLPGSLNRYHSLSPKSTIVNPLSSRADDTSG